MSEVYTRGVRYLIGVDEAGRGALAGPVCVGAVYIPADFDWKAVFSLITLRGKVRLRDSKQLNPQKRTILFEYIEKSGMHYASALVPSQHIDQYGIVSAVQEAVHTSIGGLPANPRDTFVQLDAGLKAAPHWKQDAYVKGDERFPAIALASIVAKVTRDRYMEDLALVHGEYGFDQHKGYGTEYHRRAIKRLGPCPVHRRTFLHI